MGFDLDGTFLNTFEIVRREANQRFGTEVKYEQLIHYPISPAFHGSTAEQISRIFDDIWLNNPHRLGLINDGGNIPMIIKQLKGAGDIEVNITTSAAKGSKLVTPNIKTVIGRLGMEIDEGHIYHVKNAQEKAKLGMHIYFEDDLGIIDHVGEGQHIFLYPQPWVSHYLESNGHTHLGNEIIDARNSGNLNGKVHNSIPKNLIVVARNWPHLHELVTEFTEILRA